MIHTTEQAHVTGGLTLSKFLDIQNGLKSDS